MDLHLRSISLAGLVIQLIHVCISNARNPITELTDKDSAPNLFQNIFHSINKTTSYSYTSYQGSIECHATSYVQAKNLTHLQEIVRSAREKNLRVKAIGSLHSITDCICTDGIVVDMTQIKHFAFDPLTNHSTAGAGLELQDFLQLIHEKGRGLQSAPTFGGITVGGAVGVGVHGTSLKQPATISDQLVSVTFVDGLGNVREVNDTHEDFKAFRVHLGLLGIIYELVLNTTEQYKLEITNSLERDGFLWDEGGIMSKAMQHDFLQCFWFPTNEQVVLSVGDRVPANVTGTCETHLIPEVPLATSDGVSLALETMQGAEDQLGYFMVQSYSKIGTYQVVPGRTPYFTESDGCTPCLPKAVGFSHRIMTNRCKECAWRQGEHSLIIEDAAVTIDLKELPKALDTLKEILASELAGFPLVGILFRFIRESDSYMGISSGRTSVEIEWVSVPRWERTQPKMGIAAFQAFGQALIERHEGRSHWGKNGLYYTNPSIIHKAYPNIKQFIDVMRRMDPDEVFMNDFGRRIKYQNNTMTLSKAAKKRCALNEACLCQNDSDCGDEGLFNLVCSDFQEFKVCKNTFQEFIDDISRTAISSVVDSVNDIDFVMKQLAPYKCFNEVVCKVANAPVP